MKTGNLDNYKILVTGACGNLGRNLIPRLLNDGASVVGVDINPCEHPSMANNLHSSSFSYISGNLFDNGEYVFTELLKKNKPDSAIFHFAGLSNVEYCNEHPEQAFQTNISLTFHLLNLCRKFEIDKFIFPSTGLVYGDQTKKAAVESDTIFANNIYTATKLSAEALINGIKPQLDTTCIIVRLSNVYGPFSKSDTVIGLILKQIKEQHHIQVRTLLPVRDFIFIDDVITGLIKLVISAGDISGCLTINLSTGAGTSIQQIVEIMSKLTSCPYNKIEDEKVNYSQLVLDNNLLYNVTNWKPGIDIQQGLKLLIKE